MVELSGVIKTKTWDMETCKGGIPFLPEQLTCLHVLHPIAILLKINV